MRRPRHDAVVGVGHHRQPGLERPRRGALDDVERFRAAVHVGHRLIRAVGARNDRDSPGAGVAAGMGPRIGCNPSVVEFGDATSSASASARRGSAARRISANPATARKDRLAGDMLGMPKIAGRQAFFLVAARVLAGKKKNASGVADVSFERSLRVPVDSATTVLGELLRRSPSKRACGAGSHCTSIGRPAAPRRRLRRGARSPDRRQGIRAGSVCGLVSLLEPAVGAFPRSGRMGVETRPGIGESTIFLRGAYELPMQFFGRLLDAALTPHVAQRSLGEFRRRDRAACEARVNQREAEFARYHFYMRTMR